ncbi:MAG: MarC family protein [Gammaproteobacteria bacterium]|nr:MarC family protein [Gammaproteobacteria bacterium]
MELINTFIMLFIVVDPLGISPIFHSLTEGMIGKERNKVARHATLLAAIMLVIFFLIGDKLLDILSITLPAFRIAGGILLLMLSIDMVFARQSGLRSTTSREQQEAIHREDITVFPLAFPLIAGPGALTTVLLMASEQQSSWHLFGQLGVILLVIATTLISFLFTPHLLKFMGEIGTNVVSRLFGLILAALAVQFILDGIHGSFNI